MQQNYHQTRFQRPRRFSKRPAPPSANPSPQSRLRRSPAGLASDKPPKRESVSAKPLAATPPVPRSPAERVSVSAKPLATTPPVPRSPPKRVSVSAKPLAAPPPTAFIPRRAASSLPAARLKRSDRDSNSGYAFGVYTLSRRASSATRASLLRFCVAKLMLFSHFAIFFAD